MLQAISNALTFLVTVVADLFTFVLITRFILLWARSDSYNSLYIMVTRITDFSVIKIKRFIPNRKNIEVSTLALILAIQFVKFLLLGFLGFAFPNLFGLVILMIAQTAKIAINVFFYTILAQVILSWFPYAYTDVYNVLATITAPIMRPIRRKVKPVGGFDISPIPALILLQFIIILLVDPIFNWGAKIAYS